MSLAAPRRTYLSARRPLRDATAALVHAAPATPRHGAEFLAELLDLQGAMQVVDALQSPPSVAPPRGTRARATPAEARETATRRLAAAEREARQPLRDARTAGPAITADKLERALATAGAPASRRRKALETAAHEIFAPLETATLRGIETSRARVAEVRAEISPTLSAHAGAVTRLEQLDAALARATAPRREALFERAVATAREAFASDLDAAVRALPRECTSVPAADWLAPAGWVSVHLARCEALVLAAFLHERARVELLLRATLGEIQP